MVTVIHCPSCGSNNWSDYLSCVDFTVSHETFTLKKCNTCNLIATSPRPEDGNLSRYYQSDNYISHTSKALSIVDKLYLLVRSFSLKWKLRLISRYGNRVKSVLDYGCGTGDFLKICKQSNWHIDGVEPSATAREKAIQNTGSDLVPTIDELNNQKFSVITLWHVFEHVPHLNTLIQKLVSRLDEDGTLFIAVPNYRSYDGFYYQGHWAGYDVPRHLWHFSEETMRVILAKNSLQVVEIVPMKLDAFYVSMLSEKYKNNQRTSLIGLIKALIIGMKSNFKAGKTGDYSSLIYIAKK